MGLQQQGGGQKGRRYAGAAVVGAVELGEVGVFEQYPAQGGHPAVEGVAADMVEQEPVGLEEALLGMGSEHVGAALELVCLYL